MESEPAESDEDASLDEPEPPSRWLNNQPKLLPRTMSAAEAIERRREKSRKNSPTKPKDLELQQSMESRAKPSSDPKFLTETAEKFYKEMGASAETMRRDRRVKAGMPNRMLVGETFAELSDFSRLGEIQRMRAERTSSEPEPESSKSESSESSKPESS